MWNQKDLCRQITVNVNICGFVAMISINGCQITEHFVMCGDCGLGGCACVGI